MMHDEVFDTRKLDPKCRGNPPPPPFFIPPRQRGGKETKPTKNCFGNTHEHLGTRLNSYVTSATTSLAIEGVKDGDGKVNLACCSVNI